MGRFRVGKTSPLRGLVCCVMAVALFTVPVSAAGSLRVAGVAQESGSPGISCRVLYPQISGIDNKNTQHKLNVAFMEMAKGIRTEAEYEAKSGAVSAKMEARKNQCFCGLTRTPGTKLRPGRTTNSARSTGRLSIF